MHTRRFVLLSLTVCLSLTLLPLTVSGSSGNVLDWLSSLPFPGMTGAPSKSAYSNIRIGPSHAPPVVTKQFDPNNPPIPYQPGTPLSDSFHSTTIRRGIIAQKDFANGTEILKVAFEQMFNYSSPIAPGVPLDSHFNDLVLQAVHTGAVLDSQALLALRLLMQYQNQAEWKKNSADAHKLHWDGLMNDLPKPSSVCFFTQEELAELQIPIESPVFHARSQQLDTITEGYLAWDELLKTKQEYANLFPSGFTEKWYRWAYGVVLNTAIEVPIRDEEGQQGALLVLAPGFTHLNHANPPYLNARFQWNEDPAVLAHIAAHPTGNPTTPFPHGHGSVSLIATRDIKAGEEITITYGSLSAIPLLTHTGNHSVHDEALIGRDKHAHDKTDSHFTYESFFQQLGLSNSQLLVHYGIALPTNEYERVALDIGLDNDGVEEHHWEAMELKKQIIDLNELDHGTLIGIDGRLDPFFVQALRTKHLTAEDLAHLAATEYEFSPENGYLSLQNELKWQLQLVVSIENLLTAYPTTLAEDLQQIRSMLYSQGAYAHTSNMLHSLAYRSNLKRILHSLILRTLENVNHLFLNISTSWADTLHKHNLEEEAELKLHLDLTPEQKSQLMQEWTAEQAAWFQQMQDWKVEMDKWEATWNQWVQIVMGSRGLIDQVPHHDLHHQITPETVDELLDPGIHVLQLEHEEEVTVEVEDEHLDEEEEFAGHDEL